MSVRNKDTVKGKQNSNPLNNKTAHCPICNKPGTKSFRPFCSKRCADLDLSRWLKGQYAIPMVEEDGSPPDETANDNIEE